MIAEYIVLDKVVKMLAYISGGDYKLSFTSFDSEVQ